MGTTLKFDNFSCEDTRRNTQDDRKKLIRTVTKVKNDILKDISKILHNSRKQFDLYSNSDTGMYFRQP